jgi:hypothetical protein
VGKTEVENVSLSLRNNWTQCCAAQKFQAIKSHIVEVTFGPRDPIFENL